MSTPSDHVEALLALIDERSRTLTDPLGSARVFAAGGLSRGAALLRGGVLVVEAGREDLVGVFIRAVWECWCVGLWALRGGRAAMARLEEKHRLWMRRYLSDLPAAIPQPDIDSAYRAYLDRAPGPVPPPLWKMAQEVEEWLQTADTGPIAYSDIASYNVVYRLESHYSAHANFGSFGRRLDPPNGAEADRTATIQRVVEPQPSETLRTKAASAAASYLGHLAWHVYHALELPTDDLEALLDRLLSDADMRQRPGLT